MTKKIIVFVANGSEEIEVVAAVDLFVRAGFSVDTVSIEESKEVHLSRGVTIVADQTLEQANLNDYDCYYIPGGYKKSNTILGGVPVFETSKGDKIKEFFQENITNETKLFSFICAAPSLLTKWDLLAEDDKATIFPGLESELGEHYEDATVVISDNIVTSKGAGTTIDLALAIIELLESEELAEQVKTGIVYEENVEYEEVEE
jgi:4-methyl-5(b-hydroxyethyl)-thiazole monophosphate biosynthesis